MIVLFALMSPCVSEGKEIKMGFYYDGENFAEKEDLNSVKQRIERLLNISIKIDFISRLPFNLPILKYYDKPGVDLEYIFKIAEQQKLPMRSADFAFILTGNILWDLRYQNNKLSQYAHVDGYADIDNRKIAVLRYKERMGSDYLHLLLMHEWGHLLGLSHRNDICDKGVNFIMCARHGLGKINVESSYREAIQKFLMQ